ncbi:MAG: hypothetical protein LBQ51_07920 [Desulfovibrio sp.]|jgi:F-type H+-transporting ATPase subunit b|nr:hypothetical protein [Desulfovibrio sp.]
MDNMISLDHSIFIQLANFLVTVVVLNYLLVRPVRRQLAERKNLTEKFVSEAKGFADRAAEKLSGYEAALAEARAEAIRAREKVKAEGEALEREMIKTANDTAAGFLLSSRRVCASESKAAADTLLAGADRFASLAVQKILE